MHQGPGRAASPPACCLVCTFPKSLPRVDCVRQQQQVGGCQTGGSQRTPRKLLTPLKLLAPSLPCDTTMHIVVRGDSWPMLLSPSMHMSNTMHVPDLGSQPASCART